MLSLKTTSGEGGGSVREPIPAGKYQARLVGIVDLGTQPGGMYGPRRQVVLTWELSKRKMGVVLGSDGKPALISKFYTASLNVKANLRKDLEAIRGKPFGDGETVDLRIFLGLPCWIQVIHVEKEILVGGKPTKVTRDRIGTIIGQDEDDDPPIMNQTHAILFELTHEGQSIPDTIPEWLAKKIQDSAEWRGSSGLAQTANRAADDDDINF